MISYAGRVGILLVSVYGISACAPDTDPPVPRHAICQAFNHNQVVAVLGESPVLQGEWYADWSHQLNQFVATHPDVSVTHSRDIDALQVPEYTLLVAQKVNGEYWLQEVTQSPYYDYVMADMTGQPIKGILRYFTLEEEEYSQLAHYCE
ncbi:hypothetical protein [Vibrio proteolyticus]|uniref:Lipoprotein n=1 Tax=Vibrio proteolyticus NBRC 13287 TaxID=1219065 RepID=U3BQK4_VIBPR|nr:hypothetical protein [Vibrio proteolyticus]GAD68798.1 hypothetical protein VPR01S_19_00800 [Vibrio proteolyticus NBRC 13287]